MPRVFEPGGRHAAILAGLTGGGEKREPASGQDGSLETLFLSELRWQA